MHRIRFAAVTGLATLAALALAAHSASAQTFTFTSGTYSADHLANTGRRAPPSTPWPCPRCPAP